MRPRPTPIVVVVREATPSRSEDLVKLPAAAPRARVVVRLTTLVAVIGPEAGPIVSRVAHDAANVGVVRVEDGKGEDEREDLLIAWGEAQRRRTIYTLVDFDPMAAVVAAWGSRLTGGENDLDVEVGLTGGDRLPDYVLVTEGTEGPAIQWYHGLLRGFAPRRVVTVAASPTSIHDALTRLRPGRGFPAADVVAKAALTYAPTDLTGAGDAAQNLEVPTIRPRRDGGARD